MGGRPRDYVGATKRLTLAEARTLGSRWVLQPKVDGCYVTVYLNGQGRVGRIFFRNGSEAPRHLVGHLYGALVGAPHATLVGELEALTDAGEAAAKIGPRRIWLFDCLHDGTRNLTGAPYRERRDALWRMQSAVQCAAPNDDHRPRPWRRYRDPSPPGWRLTPIVEQAAAGRADWAWEEWVKASDGEGLVAVALDAPVAARSSKAKIKPFETIDASVVSVSRTTVTCAWNGHPFMVGRGRHIVDPGEVVEIRHAGWYSGAVVPRFPALVRVRRDLQ